MNFYRCKTALTGLSLLAASASVWAQSPPAQKTIPLPRPVTGAPAPAASLTTPAPAQAVNVNSYKVGPEDVLAIRVSRHPELDTLAQVLEDGSITLPRVGRLVVEGRTVVQVQEMVQTALKKVLRQPEVNVAVQTPRVQLVYVFGEVNRPGPVDYKEGTFRVTEALGRAGGPKLNPNRMTMTLTRKSGGVLNLNLRNLLANAESPENVDVKPGMYDLRDVDPTRGSIGVMEALAMAGGASPQAALSQSYILRADRSVTANPAVTQPAASSRNQEKVNLLELQRSQGIATPGVLPAVGTSPTPAAAASGGNEVALYPGDTLHIPESRASFAVTGQVLRPGTFPISDDRPTTLAEAVSLAGGPDKRAQLKEVGIIRNGNPAKGQQTVIIKADLMALLKRGDARQNPLLQPGDVVYIPETRKPDWFGKILPGLGSIMSTLYLGGLTPR